MSPSQPFPRRAWATIAALSILALAGPNLLFFVNKRLCAFPCRCYEWLDSFRPSSDLKTARFIVQVLFAFVLMATAIQRGRGRRVSFSFASVLGLVPLGLSLWEIHTLPRWLAAQFDWGHRRPMEMDYWVSGVLEWQLDVAQVGAFRSGSALFTVALAVVLDAIGALALRSSSGLLPRRGPHRNRRATVAAGGTAILVSVLARMASSAQLSWFDGLSLFLVAAALPVALVVAARVEEFGPESDERHSVSAYRALVVCAFALTGAALLLHAPLLALVLQPPAASQCAFGIIGVHFPRPSSLSQLAARAPLMAVYVLACLLPFVPALVKGARWNAKARGFEGAATGVGLLLLLGLWACAGVRHDMAAYRAPFERFERMLSDGEIRLPEVRPPELGNNLSDAYLPRWVMTKKGLVNPRLLEMAGQSYPFHLRIDGEPFDVAADGAVPFEQLIREVCSALPGGVHTIGLVASTQWGETDPVSNTFHWGYFRTLLRGHEIRVCSPSSTDLRPRDDTAALPEGGRVQSFTFRREGSRVFVTEMGPSFAIEAPPLVSKVDPKVGRWQLHERFVLVPQSGTTVDELCALLDELGPFHRGVAVSADRAAFDIAVKEWKALER